MTQWLTLSRAARLIGVPRGVLQRQVRDGELPTNDGLVSTEGLLRLYPQWSVEESGAFERVAKLTPEEQDVLARATDILTKVAGE